MNIVAQIAMIITLLITSCSTASAAQRIKKLTGDNTIVEQSLNIDLSQVERIEAMRGIDITIVEAQSEEVIIRGNSNVMEYLDIRVEDKTLIATIDSNVIKLSNIDMELIIPYNGRYNTFEASSAAEIKSTETMRMESLQIKSSSSAEVSLIAIVDGHCSIYASSAGEVSLVAKIVGRCRVEASSAAEAELTLSTDELSIAASSSAEIYAEGNCERLLAHVSSSADLDARGIKALKGGRLQASSAGSILYRDMGGFSISKSSAGSIRSIN